MKYVILKDENGLEYPVIFPEKLVHKHIGESIQRLMRRSYGTRTEIVAAGFCRLKATCYGDSESLKVKGRGEDAMTISLGESLGGLAVSDLPLGILNDMKARMMTL